MWFFDEMQSNRPSGTFSNQVRRQAQFQDLTDQSTLQTHVPYI